MIASINDPLSDGGMPPVEGHGQVARLSMDYVGNRFNQESIQCPGNRLALQG